MSGQKRRRCPVCWQIVTPTHARGISNHWDSIGRDICPASGLAYDVCVVRPRQRTVWGWVA